jgi:hypothetical protein
LEFELDAVFAGARTGDFIPNSRFLGGEGVFSYTQTKLNKTQGDKLMPSNTTERRSEPRTIMDQFYSVEFSISDIPSLYQFKIWDISTKGMCLLVKEGSEILEKIKVGDVVEMRYYTAEASKPTEYLETEIKHITKDDKGRFKGHYLVGISLLRNDS